MALKKDIVLSWSGGKDSAIALEMMLNDPGYNVRYLLTNLSEEHRRISMHGIREEILDEQALRAGIPLIKVFINGSDHSSYEKEMKNINKRFKEEGIYGVAFGDIFLEDLKKYREKMLRSAGLNAIFPLWEKNTYDLLRYFASGNYKAKICCGNSDYFCEENIGSDLSAELISALPGNPDPCGENGEYHTLVFSAPFFRNEIVILEGEKKLQVYSYKDDSGAEHKSSFWFSDFRLLK